MGRFDSISLKSAFASSRPTTFGGGSGDSGKDDDSGAVAGAVIGG